MSRATPDLAELYRALRMAPPTLTQEDVAARAGVAHEDSVRWWRAMGFPEVPAGETMFTEDDVEMVGRLREVLDDGVVDEIDILRLARLMGSSFSRMVDAQLAIVDEQARLEGADRLSTLRAEADVIDTIERAMVYVWRRHMLAALVNQLSFDRDDTEQAVGFADLSGFSRVSKEVGAAELTGIIETFESVAFDVVSTHGGRVVKLLGDEVMFVAPDLDTAVAIGVDLISRLAAIERVPPVHCGIAFGPTVTVGGDVFGPTVNLASRLTGIARPDSVALTRGDEEQELTARDGLDVRRVRRPYDLKGVGRTSIVAVRPAAETTS